MVCEGSSTLSDLEKELKTIAAFVALDKKSKSTRTRARIHEINKIRETLGEFHRLVQELKKDPKRFHMSYRMAMEEYDFVPI